MFAPPVCLSIRRYPPTPLPHWHPSLPEPAVHSHIGSIATDSKWRSKDTTKVQLKFSVWISLHNLKKQLFVVKMAHATDVEVEPPMHLQRPSSGRSQDVSHLLASVFREVFTRDVIGEDTVKNLAVSKSGDAGYHDKYVEQLRKVRKRLKMYTYKFIIKARCVFVLKQKLSSRNTTSMEYKLQL